MTNPKSFIASLLEANNMPVSPGRQKLLEQFVADADNLETILKIIENEKMLMAKWKLKVRIQDIQEQSVSIPNATVGKRYEAMIDTEKLGWNDFSFMNISGFEEVGLDYDETTHKIIGLPNVSGDRKITMRYRINGEPEDSKLHEKIIPLVINPDPKTLWKNKPSDPDAPFWKEDNVSSFEPLGDKHIVVSSKRGRSHANVGSFRDDDYAFKHFDKTGWSIVAVSDGAGSAKFSREGSRLACDCIIQYFAKHLQDENFVAFDDLVKQYHTEKTNELQQQLNLFLYTNLGKAAFNAHKRLEEKAVLTEADLKDFHATLIFVLIKKYDFGYAVLSFGVGDCPIALINKDRTSVNLMNWLDVGDYGGGTRFITMPEIFQSDKFATRFGFQLVDDFSYLMLMTDGIYDPKFTVEANLEKIEKWNELIEDLEGANEDEVIVALNPSSKEVATQLSKWMDFWSPGNHDDRTLAIIF